MEKKAGHYSLFSFIFITIFILILINLNFGVHAQIVINEVMYDPALDDNYHEWIELFNTGSEPIDVNEWILQDNYSNDTIEGNFDHGNGTTILQPNQYAIITDKGTHFYDHQFIPDNVVKLYVDDAAIGNKLGNNEDMLVLVNTTGVCIDAIEYGHDYAMVPGLPIPDVLENHSIARYHMIDTNDTSNDFFDATNATPGKENTLSLSPHMQLSMSPSFIPKVANQTSYSIPFAFQISFHDFQPNTTYELKTYVVSDLHHIYPASQTWNQDHWEYSFYYRDISFTNSTSWTLWEYLRLNTEYLEYQHNIQDNSTAYIVIKLRDNSTVYTIHKQIELLDLDESTSNGTTGGYLIGANENYENTIIGITNETGAPLAYYQTEDNSIDEGLPTHPGFYKVPCPVGTNYSLQFISPDGTPVHILENLSVHSGTYGVKLNSPTLITTHKHQEVEFPVNITNTGDFNDTIVLRVEDCTTGWSVTLQSTQLFLHSNETKSLFVLLSPCSSMSCIEGTCTIYAQSSIDLTKHFETTTDLLLLGPELFVKQINCMTLDKTEQQSYGQGELIRIKAFIKNQGNEDATNVHISFYYDQIDADHCIGSKYYESIGSYQKYPQIIWDTSQVPPGNHSLYVIVDEQQRVEEIDEMNNQAHRYVELWNTRKHSENLFITEFMYLSFSGLENEYITVHNPTNKPIDMSYWYITNQPWRRSTEQAKLCFPQTVILEANCSITLTQNATAYYWQTGTWPDYEYEVESNKSIPQIQCTKQIQLSNKGGTICIKDLYNHTIDLVCYGNSTSRYSGWQGSPIDSSETGGIIQRIQLNNSFKDTNSKHDWKQSHIIGQSQFKTRLMNITGLVQTFVSPDCSYQVLSDAIRKANHSLHINMYQFTHQGIAQHLIEALHRNVSVYIFMEGSPIGGMETQQLFLLHRLHNHGAHIRFLAQNLSQHRIARYTFTHAKYMIIDEKILVIESCNWAHTGLPAQPISGNREWGIIIHNKSITQYFLDVFLEDYNPQRCDSLSISDQSIYIPRDFTLEKWWYPDQYIPRFQTKRIITNATVKPVLSPDTSKEVLCVLLNSANKSIYVQQLYIYRNWSSQTNPFVECLINKAKQGVDVRVIMNYNPTYSDTCEKTNQTKCYLEKHNISVKYLYTNWSIFTNVHNKGVIIDNTTTLISSINWNEHSVTQNREAGIIIKNNETATWYAKVFLHDWSLSPSPQIIAEDHNEEILIFTENTVYIIGVFIVTFAIIIHDWRKREWT